MAFIKTLEKIKFNADKEITLKHHIIFWSIYFIFNILRWGSYHNDFGYSLRTNLIGFPIHMTLCYFNLYVLMPKFAFQKKYLAYIGALLLSLFIMLLVKFNLTYFFEKGNVWP